MIVFPLPFMPSYASAPIDERMKTEYVQQTQFYSSEYNEMLIGKISTIDGYISSSKITERDTLLTPIVRKSKGQDAAMSQGSIKASKNYKELYNSFIKYRNGADDSVVDTFKDIASSLKYLDISESLAQYSPFDSMIDIDIIFPDGRHLSVGKYVDEDYEDVDFSVYKDGKTISGGEMDVDDLVSNIDTITHKV